MGEYEPKIEVHFPDSVPAAKESAVKLECFALGKWVCFTVCVCDTDRTLIHAWIIAPQDDLRMHKCSITHAHIHQSAEARGP